MDGWRWMEMAVTMEEREEEEDGGGRGGEEYGERQQSSPAERAEGALGFFEERLAGWRTQRRGGSWPMYMESLPAHAGRRRYHVAAASGSARALRGKCYSSALRGVSLLVRSEAMLGCVLPGAFRL